MEIWNYSETNEYVLENFNQSLSLGLNVNQSIERALYEFETVINESETEKLMIYLALVKLGIDHSDLRTDIRDELLTMLGNDILTKTKGEVDKVHLEAIIKDIKHFTDYLSKNS